MTVGWHLNKLIGKRSTLLTNKSTSVHKLGPPPSTHKMTGPNGSSHAEIRQLHTYSLQIFPAQSHECIGSETQGFGNRPAISLTYAVSTDWKEEKR